MNPYPFSCVFAMGNKCGIGMTNLPMTARKQILAANLYAHLNEYDESWKNCQKYARICRHISNLGGQLPGTGEILNATGVSLTSMLLLKALLTFAVILTTCPTLNGVKRRFRWGWERWRMFMGG